MVALPTTCARACSIRTESKACSCAHVAKVVLSPCTVPPTPIRFRQSLTALGRQGLSDPARGREHEVRNLVLRPLAPRRSPTRSRSRVRGGAYRFSSDLGQSSARRRQFRSISLRLPPFCDRRLATEKSRGSSHNSFILQCAIQGRGLTPIKRGMVHSLRSAGQNLVEGPLPYDRDCRR